MVRPEPRGAGIPPQPARAGTHFHCATGFVETLRLARALDSLVRVSRRVGWVADIAADPLRLLRGPVPALGGATRLGRTEDSPPRSTVAPGARGPRPRLGRRRGRREYRSTAPGKRRGPGGRRCKARRRGDVPPSSRAFPGRPRAGRGAPPRRKCARRGPAAPGERSLEGIPPHRAAVPGSPS